MPKHNEERHRTKGLGVPKLHLQDEDMSPFFGEQGPSELRKR